MDPGPIRCACIDIGSNTTRLLVADVRDGALTEAVALRAFTRLGRELRRTGALSPAAVQAICEVVAEQREAAEAAGAQRLRVVATAAIRAASNQDELCRAVRDHSGLEVHVLSGDDEARLAFAGAVRMHGPVPDGLIGVVDVGGGSSEIAVGTAAAGVTWSASLAVGSGLLADAYLRSDPPRAGELRALRERAAEAFDGLDVPEAVLGLAVGGSATSTRRLVGATIDREAVEDGLAVLASASSPVVAAVHDLEPERVRLLPAGLVILGEAATRLGRPLQVGCGGLREGVCLEMAGSIGP